MEGMIGGWFSPRSCREAAKRLAAGVLEDGLSWERMLLRLHLLICPPCRRFRRELRVLSAAARAWSGALVSPARRAELEKRLLSRFT
ncbi:MAG: anti-sigma factor [Elusimicrobia bacterium]|nr:anti-sigma factor [Elusimicrobiota bacterium]